MYLTKPKTKNVFDNGCLAARYERITIMTNQGNRDEARMLRNERGAKAASAPAEGIGGLVRRLGSSLAEGLRYFVFMTTRETAFHLQSISAPRTKR